jgi:hypothetical protein
MELPTSSLIIGGRSTHFAGCWLCTTTHQFRTATWLKLAATTAAKPTMPPRRTAAATQRRILQPADVSKVVVLLDTWPEDAPVTWDKLGARVEEMLGHRWTRQTLEANADIKVAYLGRKDVGRVQPPAKPRDPTEVVFNRRIATLEADMAKLRTTLATYEERFAVHQYNALARGISVQELETPLPDIDRRRTDVDPRQIRAAKRRG